MLNFAEYTCDHFKNDTLSGIVVAIALIPEAVAFAFVAGLAPVVGLHTAFMLGLVTALIGGKPGMISGATGAMAVVMVSLSLTHGLEYVLWASVLCGLLQVAFGCAKLGQLIRMVPQPAVMGFVNGLAIVIMLSQLPLLQQENLLVYPVVLATLLIMWLLPKWTKYVPSALVAILGISALVVGFDIDVRRISDLANISIGLPSFHIPTAPLNLETLAIILPYSVTLALVGLIESLLTLSVLDEIGGKRGRSNQECVAQGVGNTICGFFGGFAGCAMIGQSMINFTSGGRSRVSSVVAAVCLLVFVVSLSDCIGLIPVGVLVGIMFMVCIKTFEWSSFQRMRRMPRSDAFVLVAVTTITVFADLAVAVISGVILSALVFAWRQAVLHVVQRQETEHTVEYTLQGALFFASATHFRELLTAETCAKKIILDFKHVRVMDSSGVDAIHKVSKHFSQQGQALHLRNLDAQCQALLDKATNNHTYQLEG